MFLFLVIQHYYISAHDFTTYSRVKEVTGASGHGEATVDILSVEDIHTGDYTCVASTELDTKEAKAHLDVLDVPKPPYTPTIVTVIIFMGNLCR